MVCLNLSTVHAEGRVYMALGGARGLEQRSDLSKVRGPSRSFGVRCASRRVPFECTERSLPADFEPHRAADDASDIVFVGEFRPVKAIGRR